MCGQLYSANRADSKFCGDACRSKNYRKNSHSKIEARKRTLTFDESEVYQPIAANLSPAEKDILDTLLARDLQRPQWHAVLVAFKSLLDAQYERQTDYYEGLLKRIEVEAGED